MCGIVGVLEPKTKLATEIFEQLLIVSQLRGTDSVGVAYIHDKQPCGYIKDTTSVVDFLKKDTRDYRTTPVPKALIGHVRAKTIGAVTVENAHPFLTEKVLGVHNGTLSARSLTLAGAKSEAKQTDSEQFFELLDTYTPEELIPKVDGAAVFVWWNYKDRKFYIFRNDKRTLYYLKTAVGTFFASEAWMLMGVISRNLTSQDYSGADLRYFDTDTLYEISPEDWSLDNAKKTPLVLGSRYEKPKPVVEHIYKQSSTSGTRNTLRQAISSPVSLKPSKLIAPRVHAMTTAELEASPIEFLEEHNETIRKQIEYVTQRRDTGLITLANVQNLNAMHRDKNILLRATGIAKSIQKKQELLSSLYFEKYKVSQVLAEKRKIVTPPTTSIVRLCDAKPSVSKEQIEKYTEKGCLSCSENHPEAFSDTSFYKQDKGLYCFVCSEDGVDTKEAREKEAKKVA